MPELEPSAVVLCESDYERILSLVERLRTPAAEALSEELSRAQIVPDAQLPVDAVAMDSSVTYVDLDTAEKITVQLVYPQLADVKDLRISIMSPVGSALIGLRVGGAITWPLPTAKLRRLQVVAVQQAEHADQRSAASPKLAASGPTG